MTPWWKNGIVYQIYPRSFQDSDGDGVGDLPGIRQRLDYLSWLGISAIWISPVYPSPMADFGYDVSNYADIHPLFGSLQDMDNLVDAAHARNIRVILDFVPNHSSSQHPWFLESRSTRDNPKRDWYIWRDPAPDGGPPNNWLAHFGGGSAWEWDEKTAQYYLHLFLPEQPDLNWRNPQVREAMLDVLRFWFERGIDGFRVDVSYKVMKDSRFRDNPRDPQWKPGMNPFHRLQLKYSENMPEIHDFNRWLRQVADEYEERVLIGEIYLPIVDLVAHYGDQDEFHLPFNFHLIHANWNAETIAALITRYEAALPPGAWPNWVLGNHDQHRFATRVGREQARLGMMLLLTLRGTPTIYYGDEIGMEDGEIPPHKIQDPAEINAPGMGLGRDPERTPMQWDDGPHAGFCPPQVEPWLPLAANYSHVNVAAQQEEPHSMLAFTRRLIALRQENPALHKGAYGLLEHDGDLLYFTRQDGDRRYLVVFNFAAQPRTWTLPAELSQATPVLSTVMHRRVSLHEGRLALDAHEAVLLHHAHGETSSHP